MGLSEFTEMRQQCWSDPANVEIFEKYRQLYALCDFYAAFNPIGRDLESLGRSVGLDWVFDHSQTPAQFVEYLDLLIDGEGVFLTVVPEGAFSFHPGLETGSWGLVHNTWAEVLDVIQSDYDSSVMEGGLPSLRYKRLIRLLQEAEAR